jgi:hypothetical protein
MASAAGDEAAGKARDLLLTSEAIQLNDRRDDLWAPSVWRPGPGAHRVIQTVSWFVPFMDTANNGVDIYSDRYVYHPVENDEEPRCPQCESLPPSAYTDSYGDWLESWMVQGHEPSFTCEACGWAGPIGDWDGQFSALVGAPAVTFFNWPPLSQAWIAQVRAVLGGRTGVVLSHW